MQCDRALVRQEGLPRTPWYRHEIYAPGYYTGYMPKALPGVREAIDERRRDDAQIQIPLAAQHSLKWQSRLTPRPGFLIR